MQTLLGVSFRDVGRGCWRGALVGWVATGCVSAQGTSDGINGRSPVSTPSGSDAAASTSDAGVTALTSDAGAWSSDAGALTNDAQPESWSASNPSMEDAGAHDTPHGGWSLIDDSPYGRLGHVVVLDEENDRMIVFGGGGNDTWELPLAEPGEHLRMLVPSGDYPPTRGIRDNYALPADSAIYDPFGKRMLVLLNGDSDAKDVRLWELSLQGTPAWSRVTPGGPAPGAELDQGRVVLDREGERALFVGGNFDGAGVWALSLRGESAWSRLADWRSPASDVSPSPPFWDNGSLVFDSQRQQLVIFPGFNRTQPYALSLATAQWDLLGDHSLGQSSGASSTLDVERDRVVVLRGGTLSTFSLADDSATNRPSKEEHTCSSAVLDAKRERILYFGGAVGDYDGQPGNSLWSVALSDLQLTELSPSTRSSLTATGPMIWDPTRGAVVMMGDSATATRTLASDDDWTPLGSGELYGPGLFRPSVYDLGAEAILGFGIGYSNSDVLPVMELASAADGTWAVMPTVDAPPARFLHVAVYDPAGERLIMHGGMTPEVEDGEEPLYRDTWALALGEHRGQWSQLTTSGPRPKHAGGAAIYDPVARRMITFGGSNGISSEQYTDLHALSLADNQWTALTASGEPPQLSGQPWAGYDPDGERMIVLDTGGSSTIVYALELEELTWHRYCEGGLAPPGGHGTAAAMVPGGLLLTGSFLFDLETAYCD